MLKVAIESDEVTWIEPVADFVRGCGARLGLSTQCCDELGQAVERACRNVLEHAYEPGEAVRYQVDVGVRPGAMVVGVSDQGLPFDARMLHGHMRELVDAVRLVNLGREGKRLELHKNLQRRMEEHHALEVAASTVEGPVVLRPAVADDAVGLARLVYRCYGYSYGSEYLYIPEKLRSLWEAGSVISVVAEAGGEIVGHLCYWLDDPADLVGESTDALVDPRCRGQHIFDRMRDALISEVRDLGKLGMVSEAVAVHPFSQKGVMSSGAVETGLMLGDLPADLSFKGIEDALPARQSCMLCYLRLNPEPHRKVYLPRRHFAMLSKIYSQVGLDRELIEAPAVELTGHGEVDVLLDTGWQEAALRVRSYGADLLSVFRSHMHHILANEVPYCYAELPLGDPAVGVVSEMLESLGFSFAGLVPELFHGDVLRLHYLTNVELDPKICAVTAWGEEVRDYVVGLAGDIEVSNA